tara:strand:- start:1047 stop:2105 length:1059 start_codon:yes stop_codon:yes gene_type:complete
MPRIKSKEFKVGDVINKSDVSSVYGDIATNKLSNINIRQEGISAEMIRPNTVFVGSDKVEIETSYAMDGTRTMVGSDLIPLWRTPGGYTSYLYPSPTSDTSVLMIDEPQDGQETIVRCSCNIFMRDYGSRTFFTGRPPTIAAQLYYNTGNLASSSTIELLKDEASSIFAADFSDSWVYCEGTRQKFRKAFSSKIPSASGLNSEIFDYGELGEAYDADPVSVTPTIIGSGIYTDEPGTKTGQDTRNPIQSTRGGATDSEIADSYDLASNDDMFFSYRYNYNVVWRLAGGTSSGIAGLTQLRVAALFTCHIPNDFEEGNDLIATYSKPHLGCGQVEFTDFKVSNFNLSAYTVNK